MKKKYTEKQWQMRHMLNDVVEHFSKNPRELRSKGNRYCTYNPPSEKPKSIGCAIGMYLPKSLCEKLDKMDETSIREILHSTMKNKLPKWLKSLDPYFLNDLQRLHDFDHNWSDTGLSNAGLDYEKHMIAHYDLPETIYG